MDLDNLPEPPPDYELMQPLEIPLTHSSFDWLSTARTNALRPYMEPPSFSFVELEELVETGYQLALDYIGDLRTDPTHLCEELNLYVEHRMEALASPPAPQQLIQSRATRFMLNDAYMDLLVRLQYNLIYKLTLSQFFHMATSILKEMKNSQYNYSKLPPRGKRLADDYQSPLKELQLLFERFKKIAQIDFPKVLSSSPTLRKCTSSSTFFPVSF